MHEGKRTPDRLNPNRATMRHMIIKLSKVKDKKNNFESNKRKDRNYMQGNPHLKTSENGNTECKNVWDATKAVLKRKFKCLHSETRNISNNLTLHLKELGKGNKLSSKLAEGRNFFKV